MTEHHMMVRCRCVACGNVTMQMADSQDPRYVKSWFCGCSPQPQGTALDFLNSEKTRKEG